jgi:hypothetical protein
MQIKTVFTSDYNYGKLLAKNCWLLLCLFNDIFQLHMRILRVVKWDEGFRPRQELERVGGHFVAHFETMSQRLSNEINDS